MWPPALGSTLDGQLIKHTFDSTYPVLFDALIVVPSKNPTSDFTFHVKNYILETFNHYKPLWIKGSNHDLLDDYMKGQKGILTGEDVNVDNFIEHLTQHRFWERKIK